MIQQVIPLRTHVFFFQNSLPNLFDHTTRGERRGEREKVDGWRRTLGGQWVRDPYGSVFSSQTFWRSDGRFSRVIPLVLRCNRDWRSWLTGFDRTLMCGNVEGSGWFLREVWHRRSPRNSRVPTRVLFSTDGHQILGSLIRRCTV